MSLLSKHDKVETRGFLLLILILITVSIGGLVEIAKFEQALTEPKVKKGIADGVRTLHGE